MKNLQNLLVVEMNFSYGVITAVGILVGVSLFLIMTSPDDVIQPRSVDSKCDTVIPVCGIDGVTYENRCVVESAGVEIHNLGPCNVESMAVESMDTESMMLNTVSMPLDSALPDCQATNECYLPFEKVVSVGTTVVWSNDDIAAHTVNSGSVRDITDLFDSGLIPPGGTFEYTFETAGSYDYFCIVHPWMIGLVTVN